MQTVQQFIDKLQALPNKQLPLLIEGKHYYMFPEEAVTKLPSKNKDNKTYFDYIGKEYGKECSKGYVLIETSGY